MYCNKRILIVGSNSFLSKRLIDALKLENKVVGIYNKNIDNIDTSIDNYPIELIVELNDDFDFVFIVGAYVPNKVQDDQTILLLQSNVLLVDSICKKFVQSKIILVSSVAVYGDAEYLPINECSSFFNPSEYGMSKYWGEKIVNKLCRRFAIVRVSSIYGVGMKQNTFVPKVIKDGLKGGVITMSGDGSRLQNYIHVDEVVEYLIKASLNEDNTVFLATSIQSVSNFELIKMIAGWIPVTVKSEGVDISKSYVYNNFYTRSKLGIMNERDLNLEIKNLIEWLRSEY